MSLEDFDPSTSEMKLELAAKKEDIEIETTTNFWNVFK
jgi:hypothetical protein